MDGNIDRLTWNSLSDYPDCWQAGFYAIYSLQFMMKSREDAHLSRSIFPLFEDVFVDIL